MVSVSIISFTTVVFGIGALILASRARKKLSHGSLRKFIDNFSVILAFVVIFSIWLTLRSLKNEEVSLSGFFSYPELIFIVFAYVGFVIASYRIVKLSEEFGFKEQGKKMEKLMKKK